MPAHPAVLWLTWRQLGARRRAIPVIVLVLLPLLVAGVFAIWGGEDPPVDLYADLVTVLIIPIIVPLVGLILGGATFGSEIDEGTSVYLLARPIPRHRILLGKALVALPVAAALVAGTALACGLIMLRGVDGQGLTMAATIGTAIGGAMYALLFMAVGLITRRGILLGLLYLAVWEGSLASLFAGTRVLSIRQYMLSIIDRLTTVDPGIIQAPLPLSTALWMSGLVTAGCAMLALRRLRGFELRYVD